MSSRRSFKVSESRASINAGLLLLCLSVIPAVGSAEILWDGGYDTGDYTQWSLASNPGHPQFAGIPAYGRPKVPVPNNTSAPSSYYGNGDLMSLVTSPVRNGNFANRVVVKNSANGSEPSDCDNGNCIQRHTNLNQHLVLGNDGVTMPYQSERWFSISHYLPSDWDVTDYGGFGIVVFEFKSPATNDNSGTFEIIVEGDHWVVMHRWSDVTNPDLSVTPWQMQMFYSGNEGGGPYPRSNFWPDGMADFPDVAASHAALQSLNTGGWTDWVANVRWDGRGSNEGGNGFLRLWKREDNGPWIEVLNIRPKETTRGGMTFNHGIGFKIPGKGFGPLAGMYMDKKRAWNSPRNRVLYNDNIKIGSNLATFSEMSPDGSSPGEISQQKRPMPPELLSAE